MEVFVTFLDGFAEMISIVLNEFFSWNILGLNVGALVVFLFVLWLVVYFIWG